MTSWWARWRLKSPASRLFAQLFVHAQIKENIKAPRHWPLCGEFTADRWIPRTNGHNAENFSSWWRHHVIVRKRPIRVKIGDLFLFPVTLKFDGWPWKTIGHPFYTSLSFVHHFKAISEFKLELQFGNAQFGSKLAIFCPVWPWNLMDDLEKQWGTSPKYHQAFCIISLPYVNSNWSYSP